MQISNQIYFILLTCLACNQNVVKVQARYFDNLITVIGLNTENRYSTDFLYLTLNFKAEPWLIEEYDVLT